MAYIDDCTYSKSDTNTVTLSNTLTQQYLRISDYMAANRLVINGDKTHLLTFSNKARVADRAMVVVQADQHQILPSRSEVLLGATICDNLGWREHVLDSDKSLIKQLTTRLNGLALISRKIPLRTKLMVANGIFMSKLCYLIQLWGGSEKYLINMLQILQNRAARYVTGRSWYTPIRRLLHECKWLSVSQLVVYHTLLSIHKTVTTGSPHYTHNKMTNNHSYKTRGATTNAVQFGDKFSGTGALSSNSFCYRGSTQYNQLPAYIRTQRNIITFKKRLKKWITENIDQTN